jgi:hypothetical protein
MRLRKSPQLVEARAMNIPAYRSKNLVQHIAELKEQQEKCSKFLLECITTRDRCPEYAERIDVVISSIETVMSQNADTLARLEAEAHSIRWQWNGNSAAMA